MQPLCGGQTTGITVQKGSDRVNPDRILITTTVTLTCQICDLLYLTGEKLSFTRQCRFRAILGLVRMMVLRRSTTMIMSKMTNRTDVITIIRG